MKVKGIGMDEPNSSKLFDLLARVRIASEPANTLDVASLTPQRISNLLESLRGKVAAVPEEQAQRSLIPNAILLSKLIDNLRKPIADVELSGVLALPFTAALLKKDEVRNAAVLAWFLDRRSRHGLSSRVLEQLLQHVAKSVPNFPCRISNSCRVNTESTPDGTGENRVDIEIDDPAFYLIIEVKIAAVEQPEQLARYCRIARDRAGPRPWAVIFLTPKNRLSQTTGQWQDEVVPLTWEETGRMLAEASRDGISGSISSFLAQSFASHIHNTIGRSSWRKPRPRAVPEQSF